MEKEKTGPALLAVAAGTLVPAMFGLSLLNNLAAVDQGLPPVFSRKEGVLSLVIDLARLSLILDKNDFPTNLIIYLLTGVIGSAYSIYRGGKFFSDYNLTE